MAHLSRSREPPPWPRKSRKSSRRTLTATAQRQGSAIQTIRSRRRRIRGDPPSALTQSCFCCRLQVNGMYKRFFELGEPYLIYIHRGICICIYIYAYIHIDTYSIIYIYIYILWRLCSNPSVATQCMFYCWRVGYKTMVICHTSQYCWAGVNTTICFEAKIVGHQE